MNEEFRVPVSQGELYVERAGSGPPVVFLHAGVLDASMWDDQWDVFSAERTVIRYDARNHGRSSTATADFYPDEDLWEVLDILGIPSAALVGNSYGGATATSFALMHPERVTGLVLAGAGITPMTFKDRFVLDLHREQAEAVEARDAERYVEAFLRYAVDGPHRQPSETDARIRSRCRAMATATVGDHHTATGAILDRDVLGALERISAPTRIIMGELDLPDLHHVADEAASRIPDAGLVTMPGCGHMMNMEQPARFTELAREHLARR